MLVVDLRSMQCPQQFVQFKKQLRITVARQGDIVFWLASDQDLKPLIGYLQKHHFRFKVVRQPLFILLQVIGRYV